jgi:hypothetical protein
MLKMAGNGSSCGTRFWGALFLSRSYIMRAFAPRDKASVPGNETRHTVFYGCWKLERVGNWNRNYKIDLLFFLRASQNLKHSLQNDHLIAY